MVATRVDVRNELYFRRAACAVFVVGSVYWLWRSSSPWNRPFWPVLGIAAAWLVLLAGVDDDSMSRRARATSIMTMALVTVAFLLAMVYAPLGRVRYEGSFGPLERTAQQLLAEDHDAYKPCGPAIEGLKYGELGMPDEICISIYDNPMSGLVRHVGYRWAGQWLVYEAGSGRANSNRCFTHLDGPWWAEAEIGDDMGCPWGFTFLGSG